MNFRPTTSYDLSFVVTLEAEAAKERLVTSESLDRHRQYLADPDVRHYVIEQDGTRSGYVIVCGIEDGNETIEFRRMVIAERGSGLGRKALREIKRIAFEDLNAHKLWLDVKDFNERARGLYESEGFVVEGVWREHLKSCDGRESVVFMSMLRSEYAGHRAKMVSG